MMIHAYNEYYLSDAKSCLAIFLDYAINDCHFSPDWVADMFVTTGNAKQFENGNPAFIAGMSGIELAHVVIQDTYGQEKLPQVTQTVQYTPEYWAGWALAEYQWYTGRRFRDIFKHIPLSQIIDMYPVYHEMDISQFIDTMEEFYAASQGDTKLKWIRENTGISQVELAKRSGINVRNIQMYEQRVNDIDKAQAKTLYKLSHVLGCDIEDILENPMQ